MNKQDLNMRLCLTLFSFCLGDAVHRHPPMNGLGANTCIQDAANLAWKVAMVEKGKSGTNSYEIGSDDIKALLVQAC